MSKKITVSKAIGEALHEEMLRDEKVFIMGEDMAVMGNVFAITKGFLEEFGPNRVIDTPISEEGFVGMAVGAAMRGLRPVVELMYDDFATECADPLFNQAAKIRYMTGGQCNVPMVLRAPMGSGRRNAGQHSQSLENFFCHFPGLKVVAPCTAADAKGLLKAAIRDDDPVFFCEETAAYRMKGEVPVDTDFIVPIGKSKVVCDGDAMTVVAFGTAALKSTKAAALLQEEGIYIDLIDLRSLRPLDLDPVIASVKRTGRLLVVDEFTEMYGISGEIAFQVSEKCFKDLKMPVQRYTLPDTIIPAGPVMEDWVMLSPAKIADRVKECIKA